MSTTISINGGVQETKETKQIQRLSKCHIPHMLELPVWAVYLFIRSPNNSMCLLISYITTATLLVCMMHSVFFSYDTYVLT